VSDPAAEQIIRDATAQLAALTADYERVCAELDALKRERLVERALRAGHPSTRLTDACDPFGIERPLKLVKR
jgi:hypothetical protein